MTDQQPETTGWNTQRSQVWVELQPMLDRLFSPFERILVDAVGVRGARAVLDIGCGAGATTLAIAQQFGGEVDCTGLDISQDLVDAASRRAEGMDNVRFLCADAQRHAFPPEQFDAIVSRFGVMFFDDPVAAFANLRAAARPGAALTCIAWRSASDNPFMTVQRRAIAEVLGPQGDPAPDAPGQFAFADDGRVRGILADAGWSDIDIRPINVPCTLPAENLPIYARRMGGMDAIASDLDEAQWGRLEAALDRGFASFVVDGVARFEAACWVVQARR